MLQDHLERQNEQEPVGRVPVHPKCRRRAYVEPKRVKRSSDSPPQPSPKKSKLRSNQPTFQWKTHCFFCNKKVIIDDIKYKNQYSESHRAEGKEDSVQLIHKIRKRCDKRNDNFVENVRKWLSISTGLVADEALYHAQCHAQFFLNTRSADGNLGCPECPKMQAVFNLTCDWLENEIDLFTLEDFQLKTEEVSSDEVCGVKRIK